MRISSEKQTASAEIKNKNPEYELTLKAARVQREVVTKTMLEFCDLSKNSGLNVMQKWQ